MIRQKGTAYKCTITEAFHHWMYDPLISRCNGVDALAELYPAWSSFNYVLGNPVNLIDPTGLTVDNGGDDIYYSPCEGKQSCPDLNNGTKRNRGGASVGIFSSISWGSGGGLSINVGGPSFGGGFVEGGSGDGGSFSGGGYSGGNGGGSLFTNGRDRDDLVNISPNPNLTTYYNSGGGPGGISPRDVYNPNFPTGGGGGGGASLEGIDWSKWKVDWAEYFGWGKKRSRGAQPKNSGNISDIPVLGHEGKLDGLIPSRNQWMKYPTEDLHILRGDLVKSIAKRTSDLKTRGADYIHGLRLTEERLLLRDIVNHVKGK